MTSRCTLIAEALGHRNAAAAAREIVNRYRTLRDLFDAAPEELTQIPGIGAKRARQLQAIFRLSQAWLNERPVESPVINNPAHAANILLPEMAHLDREVLKVVLLNTRLRLISVETVSVGTLDTTLAHPREVFKPAVRRSAASIIVAHNHPAGSTEPSPEDIDLTSRLVSAGKLIGINVLDHIIIAGDRWVSLKEQGHV